MFGASLGELSFVALLLVIVLLAQIAPRIGEAIGARIERSRLDVPPSAPTPGSTPKPPG